MTADRVVETHVSTLRFVGDRVYKRKKPVHLGFLDFSTLDARQRACEQEVVLNARLAPDVYLGVEEVRGDQGEIVDYEVVMRALPEACRLAWLAAGGKGARCVRHVAHLVARFHASLTSTPEIAAVGTRDAVAHLWQRSIDECAQLSPAVVDQEAVQRIGSLAHRYLAGREVLFDERVRAGRIVDGHGDLLAEDIFCLPDGPRILDCIEFDEKLRWGDVLLDVAFLAMDLERLDREDLAQSFLSLYREFSAEVHPASLEHHYIAYRAFVRAKIAWLRADRTGAAELTAIARRHLHRGAVRLVAVGGLPGTGKSVLAAGLADRLDAAHLNTDEIRRELFDRVGAAPQPVAYGTEMYTEAATEATYRELFTRARGLLERGISVVLDGSFSRRAWQAEVATLAAATSSDLTEVRCTAPREVSAARIASRLEQAEGVSDADLEIAARMAEVADPWVSATEIDTSTPRDVTLSRALALVALRSVADEPPAGPSDSGGARRAS